MIGFAIRLDGGQHTGVGYAETRKALGDDMTQDTALRTSQTDAVLELNDATVRLRRQLADQLGGVEDPLLPGLVLADDLVRQAKLLRALLLDHARRRGQSWAVISAATSVPSTTWRDRYARSQPEGTT